MSVSPLDLSSLSLPVLALIGAVAGFFVGSIPTGVIVARLWGGVDLTKVGSGKTGGTNVLRTLGKTAGAIVFVGDWAKGGIAALIAMFVLGGNPWVILASALAATAGHTYSPWIGFKGGRGVMTGGGASFVAAPLLIVPAALLGILAIYFTRYVSLGSIVAATTGGLLLVIQAWTTGEPAWAVWGLLVAGFIDVAHVDNIQRLRSGTERKIGQKAEPLPTT